MENCIVTNKSIFLITPATTEDFLHAADDVRRMTRDGCNPAIWEDRERIARRLREMSDDPAHPDHLDALASVAIWNYSSWSSHEQKVA